MHAFQRIVRAHDNVFRRADETTTSSTQSSTTSASSTTASSTSTSTKASTTSTSTTTTSSSTSKTTATTSTTDAINISSLLGLTSTTTSTSTSQSSTSSSSSSTSSTLTSHSSSTYAVTQTLTSSVAAASASASESAKSSSSGLSGAETGGIVAGCILAGLALLIFAIRKTFIRRRQRKRNTWGAGMFPDVNDKYTGNNDLPPPIPEKGDYLGVNNASPRTPVWAPARPTSPNPSAYQMAPPAPPSATYNNPMMEAIPSLPPQFPMGAADPVGFRSPTTQAFRPSSSVGETATVRVVYVPTLPDELSISAGEIVSLIKAYDDGWALCQNSRGEQGVCPLECLDRSQSGNPMIQQGVHSDAISVHSAAAQDGDWRNVKRLSSLSSQQQHY